MDKIDFLALLPLQTQSNREIIVENDAGKLTLTCPSLGSGAAVGSPKE